MTEQLVIDHMTQPPTDSPLEAAAGAASPETVGALKLLANETRLAILLALWEAYEPFTEENDVSFSELRDQVGVQDPGNFNYHLNQLTDHFVDETDGGYALRNAGITVVQTVIAGTGLGPQTQPPTEIDMSCHRCGAPVELSYEDAILHICCTACEGNVSPSHVSEAKRGTLISGHFAPAGLGERTLDQLLVAFTLKFISIVGLYGRGVCTSCSGPVEQTVTICEAHEAPPEELCPNCGTRDEVRVDYVCEVCKYVGTHPAHIALLDHPHVVRFSHRNNIPLSSDLNDASDCSRFWKNFFAREQTLVSTEPVSIQVAVPGNGETIQLTVDGDLNVHNQVVIN